MSEMSEAAAPANGMEFELLTLIRAKPGGVTKSSLLDMKAGCVPRDRAYVTYCLWNLQKKGLICGYNRSSGNTLRASEAGRQALPRPDKRFSAAGAASIYRPPQKPAPFSGEIPSGLLRDVAASLAGKYWSPWTLRQAFDQLVASGLTTRQAILARGAETLSPHIQGARRREIERALEEGVRRGEAFAGQGRRAGL